jgi:hypothetical protein
LHTEIALKFTHMHLKFSKNFRGYTANPVTKRRGRKREGREGRTGGPAYYYGRRAPSDLKTALLEGVAIAIIERPKVETGCNFLVPRLDVVWPSLTASQSWNAVNI